MEIGNELMKIAQRFLLLSVLKSRMKLEMFAFLEENTYQRGRFLFAVAEILIRTRIAQSLVLFYVTIYYTKIFVRTRVTSDLDETRSRCHYNISQPTDIYFEFITCAN